MDLESEQQARKQIKSIVAETLALVGLQFAPPYTGPIHPLTKALGIEVLEEKHPLSNGDGYYSERPHPTIMIDPSVSSSERRNFTFYHELGHYLIRRDDALFSFVNEYGADKLERTIERYCNQIAAEFLVPIDWLKERMKGQDFSVTILPELNEALPASIPAIVTQMAQIASHECILVVCEYGELPSATNQPLYEDIQSLNHSCLHIRYSSSSLRCKYTCSRYQAVPKHHLISIVYEEQGIRQAKDQTIFRNGKNWPVKCEALYHTGRVIAEFRFSDPVPSSQPSLFDWV